MVQSGEVPTNEKVGLQNENKKNERKKIQESAELLNLAECGKKLVTVDDLLRYQWLV
jgi:hypothetical protein